MEIVPESMKFGSLIWAKFKNMAYVFYQFVFNYMEIVTFTSSPLLMTHPYEAAMELECFATQCPGTNAQAPMATVFSLCLCALQCGSGEAKLLP